MKATLSAVGTILIAGSLGAADAPKYEVTAAAKKLAGQANYSWKSTVAVPESAPFKPEREIQVRMIGPTQGKTAKDGMTHIVSAFGDAKVEVVIKGDKAAVLNEEGAWQSATELENAEGLARFPALFARSVMTPAAQAAELASHAKELAKDGDAFSGDLTEEGAKAFLRSRRGGDGPAVSNAKGSVKFWLKEGDLVKYEYKVQGTINFGGNDVDVERTTTIEIKGVGETKVDVPEEASKLVQ
jgi:hypothetical protein